MSVITTHNFGQFLSVLWTVTHDSSPFWGPVAIFTIDDPHGVFACPASILTVLVNSDRFADYYSLFWGLGVISTICELRRAFTCRSSTLTIFASSGPFRGLLLAVLGS